MFQKYYLNVFGPNLNVNVEKNVDVAVLFGVSLVSRFAQSLSTARAPQKYILMLQIQL